MPWPEVSPQSAILAKCGEQQTTSRCAHPRRDSLVDYLSASAGTVCLEPAFIDKFQGMLVTDARFLQPAYASLHECGAVLPSASKELYEAELQC